MDEIQRHSHEVTKALLAAGLDPVLIQEFLETQIDVCRGLNDFLNKDEDGTFDDFVANEIVVGEVSIFSELLDMDLSGKPQTEECTWEEVSKHGEDLKRTLKDAKVNIPVVRAFIISQVKLFKEVNFRNKDKFSKEEFITNERIAHQVVLFAEALA